MNKYSQVLRTNFFMHPHSFHPHKSVDCADATICKSLYEGLTRLNLKGEVELALAKKMEISPCKKRYTFTLKDTVWSNGEKVTSKHFAKAWKAVLDPKGEQTPQAKRLFIIKNAVDIYEGKRSIHDLGISTPDDKTFIVELESPALYFPQVLAEAAYFPIFDLNEGDPTIFNGPFDIYNFEVGKKLTLRSNPLYWDAKSVRLQEIQISFIGDQNTVFSMYEQGHFDWLATPFNEFSFEMIYSTPNIKKLETTSPFWIYLNTENNKLKSANIRKALSYAIDRSEIVKRVAPGHKELYTIIPTKLSLLDTTKCAQNCTLKNAKSFFEKGLKELGLKKEDISFTFNHSNYSDHERIAVYLKDVWEKTFGITVTLKKDDWKTFVSKLRSDDYEIGGCYVCNLYDHPSYLLERFEGSYTSKWSSASFKNLMNMGRDSKEEFDQQNYFKQAEEILLEEMPLIPIYNQNNLFVCKESLKNAFPPKFMYTDFKWAYFND